MRVNGNDDLEALIDNQNNMKMRQLNIFLMKFMAFCIISFTVGCSEFLEVTPESTWNVDQFYSSEVEAEMALAGIYGHFAHANIFGKQIITFDSGTDEGYYNRRYNDNWTVGLYRNTSADADIKNFWTKLYGAIHHCNLFEEKLNKSIGEEVYNRFIAEERFLRAFAYFTLVQWFEDVPMPLSYTKDIDANHLAVTPQKQVYEQIISDFDFASKNLPHPTNEDYVLGRAHKLAAHGMLARVYMKMAGYPLKETDKYQLAKDRCDSVITDGFHNLRDEADTMGYRALFLSYIQDVYDVKESLFEISFSLLRESGINAHGSHGNLNGLSFAYGGSNTGYPSAYAMHSASPIVPLIYGKYEGDKRQDWNIPAITYTNTGDAKRVTAVLSRAYNPGKFRRWEPLNDEDLDKDLVDDKPEPFVVLEAAKTPEKNFSGVNFPILRYADILLMYAEADNEINGIPSAIAIEYLNQVRRRAGLENIEIANASVIASKENFFNELVDERLREFCFEGLRKMDLIRWELLEDKLAYLEEIIKGHSEYSESNADHTAFLRSSTYFDPALHLSLPYPAQEVEINNKLEQKSNWQ